MRSAAVAAGWNQVTPLAMTVTIGSGVTIGSSATSGYAFDTGAGFPAGSNLRLVIPASAKIIGAGGQGGNGATTPSGNEDPPIGGTAGGTGGPALRAQTALTVDNLGTIGGGGGGGGGGRQYAFGFMDQTVHVSGAGGGGGAGQITGAGGTGGINYQAGDPPPQAPNGSSGSASTGGAGGTNSNYLDVNGGGGTGGNVGQAGQSGQTTDPANYPALTGGAAGAAVTGNSNITWNSTGTRLGQIT